MESDQKKLLDLLDLILDGTSTDANQQEFIELVERNPSLAGEFIEQLRVHSLLQWQPAELIDKLPTNTKLVSNDPGSLTKTTTNTLHFAARRWLWAAIILLAVIGVMAWRQLHINSLRSPASVAEIVDSNLVVWADDTTALQEGKRIVPGRLAMKSGELTLRFRSGATVTATGNVSMRVRSDMLLLLDRGQATAQVPQWAKGFTITTPSAEVVDLGTRFGVVARNGGSTDVVVFEGQVDLKPASDKPGSQIRLTQGEGARVDNRGAVDRIVEIRGDAHGDGWTTDQPMSAESLFKSVRDNLHSSDSAKFYQIIPQGLRDDVQAYVDRPHEWNGLTVDGLPEFLRNADYIKTFNESRYYSKLELVVELSRPATVYIFFDHRVPPPEWLKEQFEDIDTEVGLDEGPWDANDTKHAVAVGGGQSIDTIFTVWRRRCKTAEKLTFGPLGQHLADCAMYGIAAQPLN